MATHKQRQCHAPDHEAFETLPRSRPEPCQLTHYETQIPWLKGIGVEAVACPQGDKPGTCSTMPRSMYEHLLLNCCVPSENHAACLLMLQSVLAVCLSGPWIICLMFLFHPHRRASVWPFNIKQYAVCGAKGPQC